jgi:hypothetical protein
MRGWVYILSNKAMPGLLKIGYTERDPAARVEELASTAVPHKFQVEYEVYVHNPHDYEKELHSHLSGCREADNREFFRCTLHQAIAAIDKIVPTSERLLETRPKSTGSATESQNGERQATPSQPIDQPRYRPPPIKYEVTYRGGKQYVNGVQEPDYTIAKSSHTTLRQPTGRSRGVLVTKELAGVDRLSPTVSVVGQPSTSWASRCNRCGYKSKKVFSSNKYWCAFCKVECNDDSAS